MVKETRITRIGARILMPLLVSAMLSIGAAALDLVPVGRAVGIELRTDGILVASLAAVDTENGEVTPAADAGIMPGDIVVRIGAAEISSAEDFMAAVDALDADSVAVTVLRAGRTIQYNVAPAVDRSGKMRLGMLLRDGVSGIGTITFLDPESGMYGALGHSVNDVDTGVLLPVGEGFITDAAIADIQKGESGTPGRLVGCFDKSARIGSIGGNTSFGIFGFMDRATDGEALTVAEANEIKAGGAVILAQIDGSEVREYSVDVSRVYKGGEDRLLVTVTDPDLLALTGGIVQGMSGCPIIQDGKLIGAVSHVLLSDPTKGYGTTIGSMLSAANASLMSKSAE